MKAMGLAVAVLGAVVIATWAQERMPPSAGRSPRRDERGRDRTATLTADQKKKVASILARYDASTLTAEDAKAIHAAFRSAGIRGGPARGAVVKAAGFDPRRLRDLAPPPDRPGGSGPQRSATDGQAGRGRDRDGQPSRERQRRYSVEQAVSDRAQLHTIAFSALAFVTGDFAASTFLPPGKVCDYFGFQYMRDIDAAGKGHNPMFLGRVACNVLHILTDTQLRLFQDLAAEQAPQFEQLAAKRLPLINAFHRQLDNEMPRGSTGIDRGAVSNCVGDIFSLDAQLSYRRADVFGKVAASLTPEQKAYLGKMKFGDFSTWPELDERNTLRRSGRGASRLYRVACMTYASEFFSWYAGSVEADVYFCPERHGTYFGGFYMKDMPAMGKRDYDISTSITGNSGRTFLELLNAEQRRHITSIIDQQRDAMREVIEVRRRISTELRRFLDGERADQRKVLALGRRYGELDGHMSWMYATAFAKVGQTLTDRQRAAMHKLRNLDDYPSRDIFLYSRPMPNARVGSSDFLFAP